MAQLNVKVEGAKTSQRVDVCAATAADWAVLGNVFPSYRVTDPTGWVNFVNTAGPLPQALSVVFASQNAVSGIVLFDGHSDVTVTLDYAPFKTTGTIPIIVRPPLPVPFPDPVRDGVPWATTLPWETVSTFGVEPPSFRRTWWLDRHPTPQQHASSAWTAAPVDRDYLRGDAWGVVMPDAPMIDGANEATKDQILSWFLDRYPEDFQHAYLTKYAGYGYTHFYLSPPDSIQGYGRTLEQFVETCRLVKSYGLYVGLNLASKYFQPRDMDPDQFAAYVDPLLDALLPEADEFVPAWEWDLWNRTAPDAITIQRHIGQRAHAAGKTCWLHFGPHTTSWFADGDPRGRFGYWDDLAGDVDGINYQSIPDWTTQELADRMVDTLWQFGDDGNRYKMRLWEDQATKQYNGHATPDDGDARGYLACCTYDNVRWTDAKVWGFCNGGRKPDGSRI